MKKIYAEGEIVGGKLQLKNPAKFKADLGNLKGNVQVTVGKKERIRSLPQNAYYHGVVLKMIADEIGESDLWELHEALCLRFAPVPAGNGKYGKALLVRKHTSEMTTFEFEQYVEKVRLFAVSELGIVIPIPNELSEQVKVELKLE